MIDFNVLELSRAVNQVRAERSNSSKPFDWIEFARERSASLANAPTELDAFARTLFQTSAELVAAFLTLAEYVDPLDYEGP